MSKCRMEIILISMNCEGQSGLGKESPEDVLKTSKPQPNQEPIAGGTNAGISGETHDTGNTLSEYFTHHLPVLISCNTETERSS